MPEARGCMATSDGVLCMRSKNRSATQKPWYPTPSKVRETLAIDTYPRASKCVLWYWWNKNPKRPSTPVDP